MNNSEEESVLIQYLDGSLDEAARLSFERELATDGGLRAELANMETARQAIRHYGLKAELADIHREVMESTAAPAVPLKLHRPGRFGRLYKIAAGICVVILLALLYKINRVSGDKLYQEQFVAYSIDTDRGAANTDAIAAAYMQGDYEKVRSLYAGLNTASQSDRFLAGQAYLALKQPAKAAELFKVIAGDGSDANAFHDDAEYYLALSYIADEQFAMALPIMDKIYADSNHLYHEKVSLSTLNDLKLLKLKKKF
ncbi:hypothetical protein [Pedobacter aquatilis]|uniref:hypothetical protein n=1 Tax=Pedobacter aquatilis TaxID=351343 RepID=UPI00292FDAF1|nr:hypothetical protein [Pedobacter aquatilis]